MQRLVEWWTSKARIFGRNVPLPGPARIRSVAVLLALVILGAGVVAIPFVTRAWGWVPQTGQVRILLATLLTAQAAIAALTLAVTQFTMQGVSARRDANDQMYNEYVRQSWVKPIFWGSIIAVAVAGLVFVALEFFGEAEKAAVVVPGFGNLILVSVISFAVSLAFPVLLFEKALLLLLPERWSTIRRTVNVRGVLRAVEVFLGRHRRVVASLDAKEPDLSAKFPEQDEGLADEAIRGLLGDARRAMGEHGLREFTRSLDSIKDLISCAMDRIESSGFVWSSPGGQPEWPPMRGLRRNLYSFREDVIREGNREYVFELLGLDYWLLSTGARRRCGELFTSGLESYRSNCQIAHRLADSEIQGILRDRVWLNSPWAITKGQLAHMFPYAIELVRYQERMLSDALNWGQPGEYDALHKSFKTFLRLSRWDWDRRDGESFSNALEQFYRVVLMGVSGRAITLAEVCRIDGLDSYLAEPRRIFGEVTLLADDIAEALRLEDGYQGTQWSEWEWEGAEPGIVQRLSPERYPLTFFAVRLMELSSDEMPAIDLHGTANQILSWFESNADRLLPFVTDEPGATREKRSEWAAEALAVAVTTDEAAEEYRIINSKLSIEKVAAFKSGVNETAHGADSIQKLFKRCGTLLCLTGDTDAIPEERGFIELVPKAPFADMPAGAPISYESLQGDQWGRGLADDVMRLLCEALDEAPMLTAHLDTPQELFNAFDRAKRDLGPVGELVAVLAGNWIDVEVALGAGEHEGFVPAWQIPDADPLAEWGEYRGYTFLRGSRDGKRRMYLVEPGSWGCFVCARYEREQDFRIDIKPLTSEQARELLAENPNHFPDEPEYENKLRKLQTYVELAICHRIEFRVKNSSQARRVLLHESTSDSPTSQ